MKGIASHKIVSIHESKNSMASIGYKFRHEKRELGKVKLVGTVGRGNRTT